jgi:hypothetical protein
VGANPTAGGVFGHFIAISPDGQWREGARVAVIIRKGMNTTNHMVPISRLAEKQRFLGYFLSAVVIAAVIFVGFAKNFYLRAWIGTRPISVMVHVHGIVMTAWVVLFLTQTFLIAKGRGDVHRKLGVLGAWLAAVVVMLGVYTIWQSILRQQLNVSIGSFALLFVAFDGLSLLLFGSLVAVALGLRRRPNDHKRLMLMASVALLPPAFGRLVAYFTRIGVFEIVLVLMCATVLSCVALDTIRHRRLNSTLAVSGGLVIAANIMTHFAQTSE